MTVTSRNSAGERAMALLKELILEEEREQAAWKELVLEEERERAANQAVLRETELSKDDARTAPVVAPTEVEMLILEEGEHVANQAVLGETELSKDEARTATGAPPTEAEVAKPEEPSPGGDASGAKENKYSCPSEKTPVNVGDATARNEKIRSEDDIFAEFEADLLVLENVPPTQKKPDFVTPLLQSCDERELYLVQCLIRDRDTMLNHLRRALEHCHANEAEFEFRGAERLCRALIKTAENLAEHRYAGVQHIEVLEHSGATVGLANKIQQRKQPKPHTAEARLVEHLHGCECEFDRAASQFSSLVRDELNKLGKYPPREKPALFVRNFNRWEGLHDKALKLRCALSALVNKLERGHRQVVVKNVESLNPERSSTERPEIEGQNPERRNAERHNTERTNTKIETVRDQDGQRDSAPSGENGKPRKRIPLVN